MYRAPTPQIDPEGNMRYSAACWVNIHLLGQPRRRISLRGRRDPFSSLDTALRRRDRLPVLRRRVLL